MRRAALESQSPEGWAGIRSSKGGLVSVTATPAIVWLWRLELEETVRKGRSEGHRGKGERQVERRGSGTSLRLEEEGWRAGEGG